uniref:Anti-proliferative protein domain-containing protein n=3 Tax=Proconiini TaxID=565685 RepID=A0A1B6EVT9_9HEMI
MHIEVQVALNFVISYLYNKLPRRRVNIFGEELEKALKDKFSGHWYPEKPFKGSAFRCLKTGDPVDPVLERAARESGVPIQDILENLPQELAVWVDPGEVSYRIGEKGAVKVLFSEATDVHEDNSADREVNKTFNPEAQCFRPIEAVGAGLGSLSLSPNKPASPFPVSAAPSASTSPAPPKTPPSPAPSFMPRPAQPLTFTTATFAQTKFGSTKLKTNSKRANRMSPTEFSNYIKQRAIQQQMHHPPTSPGGRSLSPAHHPAPADYFFPQTGPGYHYPHSGYPHLPDLYHPKFPSSYLEPGSQFYPPVPPSTPGPGPLSQPPQPSDKQQLLDSINSFGLASYPAGPSQYQHLLVAN